MKIPTGILVRTLACAIVVAHWPAAAQWLHYPTPGIPRTADGKPNLTAPTPRAADGKPDLSGMWRATQAASGEADKAIHTLRAQPWAEAVSKKRKDNLGSDGPGVQCLPFGPRGDMDVGKIIQTPGILMMLFEDLTYRQVFLDGRPLPDDPNPTWMGYSVGHWDKDTLVIESAGYNDRTWLDSDGHPHSEALRVTERLRRPDFGHLEVERTFEDPKALVQRWVVPVKFEFDADTEMLEYVCAENERDRSHLVGKASDDQRAEVKVAPAILKQYVGVYEFKPPDHPEDPLLLGITLDALDGNHLMLALNGGAPQALTAESETKFFFEGAHLEFVSGEKGAISYLNLQVVEGDFKAIRK